MLADVGQRLLGHPVEDGLQLRGEPAVEAAPDVAGHPVGRLEGARLVVERRLEALLVQDRRAQLRHQPPQPADAAGQVVLHAAEQRLGLLLLASLHPGAGPAEAVAERGQLLHRAVVEVGGQPQPLLLGRTQHRLHDPLALGLQGDLAGQAAHAGQREQEQHHRAAGDHRHVERLPAEGLDDQHRRGHQRSPGEQHQPEQGQPGADLRRLGERDHGGCSAAAPQQA